MGRRSAEDGISEVVGFVVILAVVVAAISLYLTYAVPVQGREEEITEMDGVRAWFVDYKTGMDQLWLNSPLMPDDSQTSIDEGPALFNSTIGQVTLRRVINAGTVREKGFVERYLPAARPDPILGRGLGQGRRERSRSTGWRSGERSVSTRTDQRARARVHLAQQLLVPAGVLLPARRRLPPAVGPEGGAEAENVTHGRGAAALDLRADRMRISRRRSSSSP